MIRSKGFWVIVVLLALGVGLLARPGRSDGATGAATSTAPDGTRALVELLESYGASVSVNDATGTERPDVLVVTATPQFFGSVGGLLDAWEPGVRVVALDDALDFGTSPPIVALDGLVDQGPACTMPELNGLGPVSVDRGQGFSTAETDGWCYTGSDSTTALVVSESIEGHQVISVGDPRIAHNENLASSANAAFVVRLVGAAPGLDVAVVDSNWVEIDGPSDGMFDLIPTRVTLGMVQGLFAIMVWLWFRGRRFGVVVDEPQLVEIPASLLVRSSAELHRRAKSHAWAAEIIRNDFELRVRREFRIPAEVPLAELVQLVAARSPTDPTRLHAALTAGRIVDEPGLVHLRTELDALAEPLFGLPEQATPLQP